jgi:type I restriction-modification system DNA methylase subunit
VSKAPPSPSQASDRIAGHLQRITHQHFFKSFDDWLALAVNAFLRHDEAYMKIMSTYGPREPGKTHPADHFAHALGEWMSAMQSEPADYLGRVYEEQAVVNKYAGQFFTPESLTELMASITMPDALPDTAIVSDPACGSGRMLIAGIRRNRYATFLGTDTDLTCVQMTALNCLVRNANSYIVHGNSLSLESWGGLHVRRMPFGGELHRLTQVDSDRLIRMPFAKPDATTALTSAEPPQSIVQDPTPEAAATIEAVARQFTTDKKGQGDFGF